MDNNALKLKYQSCKLKVKQWEDDFMRNNGKIPTKDDIRNASQSVRYAYKHYHTLKIELLQATKNKEIPKELNNASETQNTSVIKSSNENLEAITSVSKVLSFDDGNSQSEQPVDEVLSNVLSALQKIHSDNKNAKPAVNSKPKKEIIPVYNSHLSAKELNTKLQSLKSQVLEDTTDAPTKNDEVSEEPADPDMPENVKDAWGSHLNKREVKAPKSKVRNFRERTASFQLTEKLFGKSQFKSKRNPLKPRIPLRRSKSECFSLLSNLSCDDSNSISASEVVNSQPTPEPLPVEHDADQDPFSFDLFSESKCKVVIKDSSSKSSQTNLFPTSRSLISEPKRSLDLGWISRCTGTTDSSPLVDFAAQMQEDMTRQSAIVKKDIIIPKTSDETPIEKAVHVPKTQNEHIELVSQLDVIPRNVSRSPEMFTNVEQDHVPSSDNDNEIVSDSDTETPQFMKKRQGEEIISPLLPCRKKAKVTKIPNSMMTQQDKLEKKISEGRVNENFVKINLKKKIFVRGRKNTSYSKYKKMMYKKKQVGGSSYGGGGKGNCFKCGEAGHWANKCPNAGGLMPSEEADEIDDSPYLTLEEAGALADEKKPVSRYAPLTDTQSETTKETDGVTADSQVTETETPTGLIQPLYPRPEKEEDSYLIDTPLEVWQALKQFGHSTFRPGQEEAIMRILSGMSTLVMLSTGAGKSLCYQLPAYLYAKRNEGCIALVVSPLVSLMEDQVENLPKPLRGACLHMNQSAKQREQVEEKLKEGQLHVLLVSPETIVQSERQGGLGGILKHLPPIAFACIDEAHCVSQWSHNFRPAYLMLCKVLRERLKIRTVLGLTATATGPTAKSIAEHLDVPDGRVISDMPMPSNLVLSVSRDDKRDVALIKLLQGERFSACDSIIIYCIRREECERIAGLLRTCLQDPSKRESSKRRALSWNSEAYHAGLSPYRRKQVQQAFMSGKLRIVVATVAFGMGINKNNLRAVIHYNMPSSFERFVQEVGRAGRDGLPAHCHLFLDSQGKDLNELRRHIYSDSTDRHILRKLLLRVFKSCKCKNAVEKLENWDPEKECQETSAGTQESPRKLAQVQCPGHEVAFLTEETVQALDLPEENILTLLCYLELHPKRWLEVLSPAYVTCKVTSYGGSAALKAATKKCPPLAMAVALDHKAGISHEKSTSIEFPVVDVASAIGWDSGQAKRQLKELEWRKMNDKFRRSSLVVQLSGPGLRVRAKGCLPPEDLDEALDWLMARVERQENSKLLQLEALFLALTNISYSNCDDCLVDVDMTKCDVLKEAVKKYFDSDENEPGELKLLPGVTNEEQVRANVCSMVSTFTDTSFTGRAIARIFHGIASPCFPPHVWGRTRFWRMHLNDNFTALCKIASSELLRLRT